MKVINQQTEIDITTAVKQMLIDNAIELMKQTKKINITQCTELMG